VEINGEGQVVTDPGSILAGIHCNNKKKFQCRKFAMIFKSAVLIFIRYTNNEPNIQKTKHMFWSCHWVMIYKLLINLQVYLTKLHYKCSNPLVYRFNSFSEHCS
jgi:hypothetical protein